MEGSSISAVPTQISLCPPTGNLLTLRARETGMNLSCALPATHPKATFDRIYSGVTSPASGSDPRLLQAALYLARKALGRSHDDASPYHFAADSLQNTAQLHRQLARGEFVYRPGIELHFNTNGKDRTIYLYPWRSGLWISMLYRELTNIFSQCV